MRASIILDTSPLSSPSTKGFAQSRAIGAGFRGFMQTLAKVRHDWPCISDAQLPLGEIRYWTLHLGETSVLFHIGWKGYWQTFKMPSKAGICLFHFISHGNAFQPGIGIRHQFCISTDSACREISGGASYLVDAPILASGAALSPSNWFSLDGLFGLYQFWYKVRIKQNKYAWTHKSAREPFHKFLGN